MDGHHEQLQAGEVDGYCRGLRFDGTHVRLMDASESVPMFWLSGYEASTGTGYLHLQPHSILGVNVFTGERDAKLDWIKDHPKNLDINTALDCLTPSTKPQLICLGIAGMFLGDTKPLDLDFLFEEANGKPDTQLHDKGSEAEQGRTGDTNNDEGDDAATESGDEDTAKTSQTGANKEPRAKILRQSLQNLTSIITGVIWVQEGHRRVSTLWMGDAVASIERKLAVEKWGSLGAIKVLKLSHHGSRGSTPPELLKTLNPERCVVSAGSFYWHTGTQYTIFSAYLSSTELTTPQIRRCSRYSMHTMLLLV